MKKIKYIFLSGAIIFASLLQSCEDKLDILPNSSLLSETAFRTVDDLQNALNSGYGNYDNSSIRFNSIFTDNTKVGVDNGGQELTLHGLVLDASSGVAANFWLSRYRMVDRANRIIDAANKINVDGRQAEVNLILGQSYAMRAFAHFELFQYYTPDYLDPNGLSIPYSKEIISVQNLPRNTVSEVLASIEDDLATANSLLTNSFTDNKFFTKDFIIALRARVALFSGNYDDAYTYANQLIAKYALANKAQYVNMFLDSDNTEVIFKFVRVLGDARPGYIWHFSGGGPFIEMSNSLFNKLDTNDARYGVLLNEADSDPGSNLHLINKYPGTAFEFLSDVKLFRVSEMYLIKAEVEVRRSLFNDAKNTLKDLRDARFGADTGLATFNSIDTGLDYILGERRIELAYEGHRYLDLKRLGKNLEREDADCSSLDGACTLLSTDHRFTLPIPLVELNANPLPQNPGY